MKLLPWLRVKLNEAWEEEYNVDLEFHGISVEQFFLVHGKPYSKRGTVETGIIPLHREHKVGDEL